MPRELLERRVRLWMLPLLGLCLASFGLRCDARAVNVSNTWTMPQEGLNVFYRFFRDRISWFEADAVCQFHHANLVTVDNSFQFDATRDLLRELDVNDIVWIGLMRPQNSDRFMWSNSRPLVVDTGYWAESLPLMDAPLCAVIDPIRDYRWHALRCGGPETASFLCEMPVPSWADACILKEMPNLTMQYMADTASIELIRNCQEEGLLRHTCKGKEDREQAIQELICPKERLEAQRINDITNSHFKSLQIIKSIRTDNNENNNIELMPLVPRYDTSGLKIGADAVPGVERFSMDRLMMADEPAPVVHYNIPDEVPMPVKKSAKKVNTNEQYDKKLLAQYQTHQRKATVKPVSPLDMMMGDQPALSEERLPEDVSDGDVSNEIFEPLPHRKKVLPQDLRTMQTIPETTPAAAAAPAATTAATVVKELPTASEAAPMVTITASSTTPAAAAAATTTAAPTTTAAAATSTAAAAAAATTTRAAAETTAPPATTTTTTLQTMAPTTRPTTTTTTTTTTEAPVTTTTDSNIMTTTTAAATEAAAAAAATTTTAATATTAAAAATTITTATEVVTDTDTTVAAATGNTFNLYGTSSSSSSSSSTSTTSNIPTATTPTAPSAGEATSPSTVSIAHPIHPVQLARDELTHPHVKETADNSHFIPPMLLVKSHYVPPAKHGEHAVDHWEHANNAQSTTPPPPPPPPPTTTTSTTTTTTGAAVAATTTVGATSTVAGEEKIHQNIAAASTGATAAPATIMTATTSVTRATVTKAAAAAAATATTAAATATTAAGKTDLATEAPQLLPATATKQPKANENSSNATAATTAVTTTTTATTTVAGGAGRESVAAAAAVPPENAAEPELTSATTRRNFLLEETEPPFRPNRRRSLTKPETVSYFKKILG